MVTPERVLLVDDDGVLARALVERVSSEIEIMHVSDFCGPQRPVFECERGEILGFRFIISDYVPMEAPKIAERPAVNKPYYQRGRW